MLAMGAPMDDATGEMFDYSCHRTTFEGFIERWSLALVVASAPGVTGV
jgi:hypothetical protein